MPNARFEWYRDKAGKFRFRLVAPNGQTIAVSEAYETKDACINGIESVRKNSPIAKIVEVSEYRAWKKGPSTPLEDSEEKSDDKER
jgi:uncharacterized protein YegP (UPF0339 family)